MTVSILADTYRRHEKGLSESISGLFRSSPLCYQAQKQHPTQNMKTGEQRTSWLNRPPFELCRDLANLPLCETSLTGDPDWGDPILVFRCERYRLTQSR